MVQLATEVHTHPTLSEVVEAGYKQAAAAIATALIDPALVGV